ncbi:MAG: hypothetical protein PHD76_07385 [Methylacidiphilales bacterium]|nr:hypothetical protein [Candidatus Methylacidiphilales bacterium]
MASELVKRVKKENDDAAKRISEIDKIVNPIMEETAVKLYGIKPEEFRFLRMQSQSQAPSTFFSKQRRLDTSSIDGIVQYFDDAYQALQAQEFWFGREETLVPQDAQLYETMKADVLGSIASRPDGSKILDMLNERAQLEAKLNSNLPLYTYLSQRREWWKYYPDYKKAVESDSKVKSEQMSPP